MTFIWNIRVYYEDTDTGGVVYHAQYLNFLERARTECLRNLGYEQDILRAELKVIFVVQALTIKYLKPAYFNDMLKIESQIISVGKASAHFKQTVMCDDELLLTAFLTVVCVAVDSFKPTAIPLHLYKDLRNAV